MSDSIPDMIAEARKAQWAVYISAPERVADDLSRIIRGLADALEALSSQPELEVEYRASIGGVVFGGVRTTPEAAIDAAWSAYADYSFSVDDENFHVTSRTVGQWTPVEKGVSDDR